MQKRDEFGPSMSASRSAHEKLKEDKGKLKAESDLDEKKGLESLARVQSVPWHRDSAGRAPSYQARQIPDSARGVAMPGRDGKLPCLFLRPRFFFG
jgi:hypothetical protein